MTEETNQVEELHDEVTDEFVEETLDEANAPAAKAKPDANATDEEDAIASVDKAADATKAKQAPAPKTKAGMINVMSMKMHGMKKTDLQAAYSAMMDESVDMEEDEVIAETSVDTTAELNALVESEATLSDEFKAKTAVIFEAAVKSKLSEEVDRIETQYKEELAEEIASTKSDLVEKVDSYLNYVVETWMEENQVAIQSGLRTEIAETFMDKMKGLFTESYIEVPESKVDLVDELAESVEELEGRLNETTQKVIDTTEELEVYKRETIIRESSRELADTQVEKLKSLVADIDFDSEEQFAEKVAIVVESHFAKQVTGDEEVEAIVEDADQTVELSSSMDSYLAAIRKTAPKA
jgi:hypothetical protein